MLLIISLIILLSTLTRINCNSNHHLRISGGFLTNIEHYPFLVSIRSSGYHICGGAILKPNLIITSANCVYNESIKSLSIMAGSSSLDKFGQIINIIKINIHEMYNDEYNKDCNVALITLKSPLLFGRKVQPIGLQKHLPKTGLPTLLSGWGVIVGIGSISLELRAAGLRILDQHDCDKKFGGKGFNTERLLCAGVSRNSNENYDLGDDDIVGPCTGDEGSPLICTDEMALCGISWIWNYDCGYQMTNDKSISGYKN